MAWPRGDRRCGLIVGYRRGEGRMIASATISDDFCGPWPFVRGRFKTRLPLDLRCCYNARSAILYASCRIDSSAPAKPIINLNGLDLTRVGRRGIGIGAPGQARITKRRHLKYRMHRCTLAAILHVLHSFWGRGVSRGNYELIFEKFLRKVL